MALYGEMTTMSAAELSSTTSCCCFAFSLRVSVIAVGGTKNCLGNRTGVSDSRLRCALGIVGGMIGAGVGVFGCAVN